MLFRSVEHVVELLSALRRVGRLLVTGAARIVRGAAGVVASDACVTQPGAERVCRSASADIIGGQIAAAMEGRIATIVSIGRKNLP